MSEFKYVVIGGGMTEHATTKGIRSVDASGSIAVFGDELAHPDARPSLGASSRR